jgi:hypothetical protein
MARGGLYVMDLDTSMALRLPELGPLAIRDVAWDPGGDVAALTKPAGKPEEIVVASLASRGVDVLPLPNGLTPVERGLVAFSAGRLLMTFEVKGAPVTYMMVPGASA